MNRRGATLIVISSLAAAAACHSSDMGGLPPLVACTSSQAAQVVLAPGADTSIDAMSGAGCATFPKNASTIDSAEYLVVAQSATTITDTSAPFQLRSVALSGATLLTERVGSATPGPTSTAAAFDHHLRQLGRQQIPIPGALIRRQGAAALAPAAPVVGSARTFAVCGGLVSCTPFKSVYAVARAVGAHVAIYVDTAAPKPGLDAADMDTLKQVFDTLLYPLATTTFGAVSDLDNNGVVIALMTPVVNAMVTNSQCINSGYLAGFFFPLDLVLSAPTTESNHGEIFYSIVPDSLGTLSCGHTSTSVKRVTPGVFVHEFQHMINFAQHFLFHSGSSEEGWLDEGQSKYAEELAGRRYLPQDTVTFHHYLDLGDLYDASQYLAAPDTSALLLAQDQGTLPEIGASWLFVRYLMDQNYAGAVNAYGGAALAGQLDQTAQTGATNVATRTGQPFARLLEKWALANWVSDLPGFTVATRPQYTSWSFRAIFDTLSRRYPGRFPTHYPLVPLATAGNLINVAATLKGGSGYYVRALQAPGAAAFTLQLSGPGTALPAGIGPRYAIIRIR